MIGEPRQLLFDIGEDVVVRAALKVSAQGREPCGSSHLGVRPATDFEPIPMPTASPERSCDVITTNSSLSNRASQAPIDPELVFVGSIPTGASSTSSFGTTSLA